MKIFCPSCKKSYFVNETYPGQMVECTECKRIFAASPKNAVPANGSNLQKGGNGGNHKMKTPGGKRRTGKLILFLFLLLAVAGSLFFFYKQKEKKEKIEKEIAIRKIIFEYEKIKKETAAEIELRAYVNSLYEQLNIYSRPLQKLSPYQKGQAWIIIRKIEELTGKKCGVVVDGDSLSGYVKAYSSFLQEKQEKDIAAYDLEIEARHAILKKLNDIGIKNFEDYWQLDPNGHVKNEYSEFISHLLLNNN